MLVELCADSWLVRVWNGLEKEWEFVGTALVTFSRELDPPSLPLEHSIWMMGVRFSPSYYTE